jgi:putative membrane protein
MQRNAYEHAKNFIDKVVASNKFEIYTSELALKFARSIEVKNFARQMIEDHLRTGEDFAATLQKTDIAPPIDALDLAYTGKFIELRAFDAREDFDCSYVMQQMVVHEDAICLFSDYATSGEAAELKAFATRTLPALEHHLQMAKALSSRMTP